MDAILHCGKQHVFFIDGDQLKLVPACLLEHPDVISVLFWNGHGVPPTKHANVVVLRSHTAEKQASDIALATVLGKLDALMPSGSRFYVVSNDHFVNDSICWLSRACLWIYPANLHGILSTISFYAPQPVAPPPPLIVVDPPTGTAPFRLQFGLDDVQISMPGRLPPTGWWGRLVNYSKTWFA